LQTDRIFKIAVNRVLMHEAVDIHDGDHVGFLPPVTGG
jgi:molybdopterin converting factor small subunit